MISISLNLMLELTLSGEYKKLFLVSCFWAWRIRKEWNFIIFFISTHNSDSVNWISFDLSQKNSRIDEIIVWISRIDDHLNVLLHHFFYFLLRWVPNLWNGDTPFFLNLILPHIKRSTPQIHNNRLQNTQFHRFCCFGFLLLGQSVYF